MTENSNIVQIGRHRARPPQARPQTRAGKRPCGPAQISDLRPLPDRRTLPRPSPDLPARLQAYRAAARTLDPLPPRDRLLIGLQLLLDAAPDATRAQRRFAAQRVAQLPGTATETAPDDAKS